MKDKLLLIMAATIAILFLFSLKQCNTVQLMKHADLQNKEALKGVTELKLKNGQLVKERALFITNAEALKETNFELAKQVEELKKNGRKIITITKTIVEYTSPELNMDNKIEDTKDGWKGLRFRHITDSTYISGISKFKVVNKDNRIDIIPGITKIDTNSMKLNIIYGTEKVNGIDKVFVTSTNPNIKIIDIEGYTISPGPGSSTNNGYKRVNLGAHVGLGGVYNNGNLILGPVVSVGLNLNFLKKK